MHGLPPLLQALEQAVSWFWTLWTCVVLLSVIFAVFTPISRYLEWREKRKR